MKDDLTDEDCLDDPIRLDVNAQLHKSYDFNSSCNQREKQATVSIDLTDSDVDLVNVESKSGPPKSPVTFFSVPRNVRLYKKCKPLSIKVVDCDKHPWFYKKYLRRANTALDDCIEISDGDIEDAAMEVKKRNSALSCEDEENDIILPLVPFTKLILSPNSNKPKIRPVDISPYYCKSGIVKNKALAHKSNSNNVDKSLHPNICKKADADHLKNVKQPPQIEKPDKSPSHHQNFEIGQSHGIKIHGQLECSKLNLKKNTGLVGLKIIHFTEELSTCKAKESTKKLKEKRKSKKHKEKKHYSSVPVIHIGENTTKESLKICLDKGYVKRKSVFSEEFIEANNNLEDKKPVILDNCVDSMKKVEGNENVCKEQSVTMREREKKDSEEEKRDKISIFTDKKYSKNNVTGNISTVENKKDKFKIPKKIKNKFDELFNCKPIKTKDESRINSQKSNVINHQEERIRKSKEVTNYNSVQKSNPVKNYKLSLDVTINDNKVAPSQNRTTLIFRDNDDKEIFKIKSDIMKKNFEAKQSLTVQKNDTPILRNDDNYKNKNVTSHDSNTIKIKTAKSNTTTVKKCDGSKLINNIKNEDSNTQPSSHTKKNDNTVLKSMLNEPIKVARHLMPPQIGRSEKDAVNKKLNQIKKTKQNNPNKKSDRRKIDPNILELVKSLGIDVNTKCSSTKTASVAESEVALNKDPRKTLPDMPGLDKLDIEAVEYATEKFDVFTHQNKVLKIANTVQSNKIKSQETVKNTAPELESLLKSNLETVQSNKIKPQETVKDTAPELESLLKSNLESAHFKFIQPQSSNLTNADQSHFNNGLTGSTIYYNNKQPLVQNDHLIPRKTKGTINVRPDAMSSVTMTQSNGKNVLRSDGAACHQIVLNKKTNDPLSSLSDCVSQLPLNPNSITSQSANNPATYENNNPPNLQTATVTHLHHPNMQQTSTKNFQNMQPVDKLALSVNKLNQPIPGQFPNNFQMSPIQTVVSNRFDYGKPRCSVDNRYNLQSFQPKQPMFIERPRMDPPKMDFTINYPPTLRSVPIYGNRPSSFAVPKNGVYDSQLNPHQSNYGPQHNFVLQQNFLPQQNFVPQQHFRPHHNCGPPQNYMRPPLLPPPPYVPHRQESNLNSGTKLNEGTKVIGENIHGVIRTINLSALPGRNIIQNNEKTTTTGNTSVSPVTSKEAMFNELTKEMAEIGKDEAHVGTKRQFNEFSAPGPVPKKPKQYSKSNSPILPTSTYPVNYSRPNPNIPLQSVGYSPPILPIPTFQKTFEMLHTALNYNEPMENQELNKEQIEKENESQQVAKTDQRVNEPHTGIQTPKPDNPIPNQMETPQINVTNTNSIEINKRKISIDEYKKRVDNPEETNNNIDEVKVKIENEIKTEPVDATDCARRQSSDLDLGYDSDSTVRL